MIFVFVMFLKKRFILVFYFFCFPPPRTRHATEMRLHVSFSSDEGESGKEDIEINDALLRHIKALTPLVGQQTTEAIPFHLTSKEEKEAFYRMLKWLKRETPLQDVLTDMHQFRSLVILADKYNITSFMNDLVVSFFIFRPLIQLFFYTC